MSTMKAHLAIFLLLLGLPALAAPATVDVTKKSDFIVVKVNAEATPKQRMSQDPRFLELAFPNTKLETAKKSIAIDKGLISRVEWEQQGSTAVVRVYVLSKPKSTLTSKGKEHIYTVSTVVMASAPVRTAKTDTTPPPKTDPPKSTPSETPPATTPPKSTPPKSTPPKTTPPATPPATLPTRPISSSSVADKKVTVMMSNVTQEEALEAIAKQVGLKADIQGVTGHTTISLTEIPLQEAVETVLGPAKKDYIYQVVGDTLKVSARNPGVKSSTPPVTSVGSDKVARDYFPFKDRPARDVMDAAQKAVPNLTYYVDDRLNILIAEGKASDLERLSRILAPLSSK